MNDELSKALAKLADKLGTTAEHLWQVLIRQARVEVVTDTGFILLTAVCLYGLWRWWKSALKRDPDDGEMIGLVICSICGLVLFIASLVNVYEIPTLIFNPEYWAIQQIFSGLK